MKLKVEIKNTETSNVALITLPAFMEDIEDALYKINCDETVDANFEISLIDYMDSAEYNLKGCNIFELNYFATMLNRMDIQHQSAFIGGLEIKDINTLPELINLALNVNKDNLMSRPLSNLKELGQYTIDTKSLNKYIIGFDNMSMEFREDIEKYLDPEIVGLQVKEIEHGVFNDGVYTMVIEYEELYDGHYRMPQELGCESIVYKLTTDAQNIQDVSKLNKLTERLNVIAKSNDMKLYYSMLETLDKIDIDVALDVVEYVDEFELDTKVKTFKDYALKVFDTIDHRTKKDLLNMIPLHDCGKVIAEFDGTIMTSYGALVSKDGILLKEKLRMYNQGLDMSLTMGS